MDPPCLFEIPGHTRNHFPSPVQQNHTHPGSLRRRMLPFPDPYPKIYDLHQRIPILLRSADVLLPKLAERPDLPSDLLFLFQDYFVPLSVTHSDLLPEQKPANTLSARFPVLKLPPSSKSFSPCHLLFKKLNSPVTELVTDILSSIIFSHKRAPPYLRKL